jgi:hypothetical protein
MARRARVDMSRVASSALEAALNGQPERRRFRGAKAVVTGAAIATVARVVVTKAHVLPGLPHLPDLSELGDSVRDRLAERGWIDEAAEYDEEAEDIDEEDEDLDEEPEDDGPDEDDGGGEDLDNDDEGGGPAAEGDEWDEEEESEVDDEDEQADAAHEEEAGDEEAEDEPVAGTPSLMDVLSDHASPPPIHVTASRRGRRRIDPATRPPEPPSRNGGERRERTANKSKAKAGKG